MNTNIDYFGLMKGEYETSSTYTPEDELLSTVKKIRKLLETIRDGAVYMFVVSVIILLCQLIMCVRG